jgi:hypothetical protein
MGRGTIGRFATACLVSVAVILAGCSDDDGSADSSEAESDEPRSTRPPVDSEGISVTGPITGGETGAPQNAAPQDLAAEGYVEEEFFLSGTAQAYTTDEPLSEDGAWQVEPGETAEYTTRILVRRPTEPERFSGTAVVEWFNVTAGMDSEPDWGFLHDELLREGHAWVGVSAQEVGVSGPPPEPGSETESLGSGGLREADPERYGSLNHPGDSFSYDIYAHAGRVVQAPADVDVLGGLGAEQVLAVGESQSAIRLTTYVNAVHPLERVYDGFLVHSRSGGSAPLASEPQTETAPDGPVRIRTDLDEPVLTIQTETDVGEGLGFLPARQDDTDRFRLWEVAGTAHADDYLIEVLYGLGEMGRSGEICAGPINTGPHHAVAKAGLHHLVEWAAGGDPPPTAERLEVRAGDPPVFERDEHGNALGGVRSPAVDVPIATVTGEPQGDGFCRLLGTTDPFTPEQLAELYPSHDEYVAAVVASAEEAVDGGFVLEPEADAMIAEAEASSVGT